MDQTQQTDEHQDIRTDNESFYAVLESALGHPIPRPKSSTESDAPRSRTKTCRFTIVIPALNEEEAVGGTLRDALEARQSIIEQTPVTDVRVVLVNDGSTDRTQAIAEGFDDVTVIRFEHNRGYGAAIKAGFVADESELVGFMDADGTLQTKSFVPLINEMFQHNSDVVLGARLNPQSSMPLIRKIGNWGFARLLGYISGKPLTDCASGMRVIKRSSLKYLMPLPDGLHFTPAMSCNALLDDRLRIGEVPVPYAERAGRSKLNVLRDGVRFLTTILLTGCFYNPIKCAATGIVFSLVAALVAWLSGWSFGSLFWTLVLIDSAAAGAALICHQAVKVLIVSGPTTDPAEELLHDWTRPRVLANCGFGALAVTALLTLVLLFAGPQTKSMFGGLPLLTCCIGVGLVLLGISLRMMQSIREKFEALVNDPFCKPSPD